MTRTRLLLCLAAIVASDVSMARDVIIHAGTLIDAVSEQPRRQVSILVHDDRIMSVEPGYVSHPGAEIIDLSSATVLPGFIDCLVHVSA